MTDPKTIENNVRHYLQQLFKSHGIPEAIIIFSIPTDKHEIKISSNYFSPPGRRMPTPLEQLKAQCDIFLMQQQTEQTKLTKS